jgi:hypothetical protein
VRLVTNGCFMHRPAAVVVRRKARVSHWTRAPHPATAACESRARFIWAADYSHELSTLTSRCIAGNDTAWWHQ